MIRSRRHPTTIFLLLILTLLAVAAVSLDLGSTRMSLGQVAATLLGQGEWIDNLVIFDLRLPRLVLSILSGWAWPPRV